MGEDSGGRRMATRSAQHIAKNKTKIEKHKKRNYKTQKTTARPSQTRQMTNFSLKFSSPAPKNASQNKAFNPPSQTEVILERVKCAEK